jgi:hypothetical protein
MKDNFSITITDYIGVIENGIAVILSMVLNEKTYEFIYWFNKKGDYRLVAEEDFLLDQNLDTIYDFPKLKHLIVYIDNFVLPPRADIYKEFNF